MGIFWPFNPRSNCELLLPKIYKTRADHTGNALCHLPPYGSVNYAQALKVLPKYLRSPSLSPPIYPCRDVCLDTNTCTLSLSHRHASICSIWTSLTPTTGVACPPSPHCLARGRQMLNKILQLKLQKFCPSSAPFVCVCVRACASVCVKNGQIATNMAHINYDKMALMSSAHTSAALPLYVSVRVCVRRICMRVMTRFSTARNICVECFEWLFRRTQNWPTKKAELRIVCSHYTQLGLPKHIWITAQNVGEKFRENML